MFHHKGKTTCLLCQCAVQSDEHVAVASQDPQQPLFPPYKQLFCRQSPCFECMLDRGPRSNCVHRDCYQYYRHLFPESQRLRLRDLLGLWPEDVDFLNRHSIESEKHAYEEHFPRPGSALFAHIAKDSLGNLLRSVAEKLPRELVLNIARFSWPCALQKPATILREGQSLLDFAKRQKSNHIDVLKFAGELALVRYCNFLGHRYATSVALQENTVADRKNVLSIAVTRDELGVLDINFQGHFRYSRNGLWYRLIQAETDNLELCVYTKNIIMDIELANTHAPIWNPYWNCQFLSQPKVSTWYVRNSTGLVHNCETSLPQRMRYVELNEDTQGIIVACAIDGFVSLEACGRGSKPYNYARVTHGFSDRTVYTFMPLHKGDFIAAAWIREPKHDVSSRQSVLVLNTSFQRTCTFGHYVPTEREHRYRFEPLLKQNAYRITGFCYNDDAALFSGRLKIGVTYEGKAIGSLTTPPLQAAYTMPKPWIPQWWASSPSLAGASKRRGWNVSSASLARANHVRMFVNNKKSHKPTMGMLLSYEDHQESLGQYRFDCDVEDYDLTGPMCFFSGETILGPYIKIICNSEEKPGWTEIPRAAKLVWWFTDVCSQLDVLTM